MTLKKTIKYIVILIIFVLLLIPVIINNFFLAFFLGKVLSSILLTTAAWALLQIAGQPVFGLSALAGICSYGYALSTKYGQVNPWLAIIIGVVCATIAGLILSLPSMKIGGFMNQGIFNIFFIFAFISVIAAFSKFTGGTAGTTLVPLPPKLLFKQLPYKYLIVLVLTAVGITLIYLILNSRLGKIIALTAKNEYLISSLGINIVKVKRLAYLVFIPLIGLAGFCDAYIVGSTSPFIWSTDLAFTVILAFWIGGTNSILGPIIGAAILTSIPTLFNMAMEYRLVISGILALIIRIYLPGGIMSLFEKLSKRRQSKVNHRTN